jgi:hypothetical protein
MRFNYYLNEATKSFTKDDEVSIYNILGKYFKMPKKKLSGNGVKLELDDGTIIHINSYMGILVIDSNDTIKNIGAMVKDLKKIFGDVYVKDNRYINARDIGEKYEEIMDIQIPKNIKTLGKITDNEIKNVKTKSDAGKIISKIDKIISDRKVKIKTKNVNLKMSVIEKIDVYSIVTFQNNIFAYDLFDLYYSKNIKEAREIIRLISLKSKLHRAIEVSSWDIF